MSRGWGRGRQRSRLAPLLRGRVRGLHGCEDAGHVLAEVLAGLSHPVPWIAFEYLPAALPVAEACLVRLTALGPYTFNLVVGEACGFALPVWLDAPAFRAALTARAADGRSGDVYARLDA